MDPPKDIVHHTAHTNRVVRIHSGASTICTRSNHAHNGFLNHLGNDQHNFLSYTDAVDRLLITESLLPLTSLLPEDDLARWPTGRVVGSGSTGETGAGGYSESRRLGSSGSGTCLRGGLGLCFDSAAA